MRRPSLVSRFSRYRCKARRSTTCSFTMPDGRSRTRCRIDYGDQGRALDDLRNGRINGVLTIPPEFSRKVLAKAQPRVALIEDNTDNFVSATLAATVSSLVAGYGQPIANTRRLPG